MSRQLWLLRHGEAEPHEARPDAERRLTGRGERQSRAAGTALARLGLELSSCYASPRIRALDTARLACESLGVEPVVHEPLAGGFDAEDAIALLDGEQDDARVLLVGHEPDLSNIVDQLTGGRADVKKGGVVALRLDDHRGELLVLLRPRDLESLAVDFQDDDPHH